MDHSHPPARHDLLDLTRELAQPAQVTVLCGHLLARSISVWAEQHKIVVPDDGSRVSLAQESNGLAAEPVLVVDVAGTPNSTDAFAQLREGPAQPRVTAVHVGNDPDQQCRPIRGRPAVDDAPVVIREGERVTGALAKEHLEAWKTQRGRAVRAFMSDDVDFEEVTLGERLHGPDAVADFVERFTATFSSNDRCRRCAGPVAPSTADATTPMSEYRSRSISRHQ
jgi:hypothetical protein